MSELTFYFDPLCPWTWRTSQWVREVQREQPLEVEWKFFSLAQANNFPDQSWFLPLRVAALARREGGNQAVNRAYLAMGQALHESGVNVRADGIPTQLLEQKLSEAGFEPSLLKRAEEDASTLEEVQAEHSGAVENLKAYGVPWLVIGNQEFGFNGPILTEVPTGDTALELWKHTSWMLTQPYFYEIKRNRG